MVDLDRLNRCQEILQNASGILDKLDFLAADDGEISNDEVNLLNVIGENITGYQHLVNEIIKDGTITDDELVKMEQYEKKLASSIMDQARLGGKISEEERDIINTLFDCLSHLGSFENM